MQTARLWPVLVSLLGHGLALGALAYFAVESGLGRGEDPVQAFTTESSIAVEEPVTADTPPMPNIEFDAPPILPEIQPEPTSVEPPALVDLPPLAVEAGERSYRMDTIPLDVARRRLRPDPGPVVEAKAPPVSRTAPVAPRPAPAGDVPPRLDPVHTPRYWPREAWDRGLRGTVLVVMTVGRSGAVIEARVLRSSGHDLLDRAALASARQWRFQPVPRPVRAKLPFRFGAP